MIIYLFSCQKETLLLGKRHSLQWLKLRQLEHPNQRGKNKELTSDSLSNHNSLQKEPEQAIIDIHKCLVLLHEFKLLWLINQISSILLLFSDNESEFLIQSQQCLLYYSFYNYSMIIYLYSWSKGNYIYYTVVKTNSV